MRALIHQAAPVVGAVRRNADALIAAIEAGASEDVDLVVGPELGICGYPPRDRLETHGFLASCQSAVDRVVAASAGKRAVVVFGAPWRADGALFNAAFVAHDGRLVAVRTKQLLPTYDVFDERRHFQPGEPSGPVEVAGWRISVSICEDLWGIDGFRPDDRYRVDPLAAHPRCDVAVNLSASPFHTGKGATRRALVATQARRLGAPLVYVNQVGGNDHLLFDGRSLVADASGALLHELPAFAAVDRVVDLAAPAAAFVDPDPREETYAALVMGVRDYAHRSGFRRALVGLSGGIDSALVATIAVDALGGENVLGVGLPGPYSSQGSVDDARALAIALGIRFELAPVSPAWEVLRASVAMARRGDLGDEADLASQNLQARIRGTILMAISNAEDRLLLTTGNKSEIATGYCTLYGDMNGALAVIGDVYKTDVQAISRWVNRSRERIPVATIEKPPSAELAPDQKDEDSLPPYAILDPLLRVLIEGCGTADELIGAGADPALARRVERLLRTSEYKRWQGAPALRVSPRAFGFGRRMPLASVWERDTP